MEKTRKVAFAVAAHPDDIEFMMAGTLVLLKRAGYEIHYMNLANGSCGTATHEKDEIVRIRGAEARSAADSIGAMFHPPLVDDLEIYYRGELASRLGAVMRQVAPTVLLVPSLQDYMEDHVNAARLAVTAAFCRGMRNFPTDPPTDPVNPEMAVYHAMPYGLHDPLRNPVRAHLYVNVQDVLEAKTRMLACHQSQKKWLDDSQGIDSYLKNMQEMSAAMGKLSGRWKYAEGWSRHLHLGFGPAYLDPISQALPELVSAG